MWPFIAVGDESPLLSTYPLTGMQLASPGKNAEPFKYETTCGGPDAIHVDRLGYKSIKKHVN